MTNKDRKAAIRARMAATGESYAAASRNLRAVTTRPSNQVRRLGDSIGRYPYVWLMDREAPDPAPARRIIQSLEAVPGWEQAGAVATLQKHDGTPYRDWRIKAVFVDGGLASGDADLDGRWRIHDVETR
jgi:hypothetical protein